MSERASSGQQTTTPFATIEEALEEIREGRMVVVCDDEDRENEGDLTSRPQFADARGDQLHGQGGPRLICLSLTSERCDELRTGPDGGEERRRPSNRLHRVRRGARRRTTGISAHDRAHTIQVAIDPAAGPDLVRPGHVFPLRGRDGGVLERAGQTEAAVDLARLAGLNPAGVICEIMNADGTMARVPELIGYCAHGLNMITVADLIDYRRRRDKLVERVVSTASADELRRVRGDRLPLAGRPRAPRGAGQGRRRGQPGRARPRPLRVPDRATSSSRCGATAASSSTSALAMIAREPAGVSCSTSPRRAAGSAC